MSAIGTWPVVPRWVLVAVVVLMLMILGTLSLAETTQPPRLGLRASRSAINRFVISHVQPASRAWDAGIRPGDIITAVNGQTVQPTDDPTIVTLASSIQVHSISKTTRTTLSTIPFSAGQRWSFLVIAVCFMLVGAVVAILAAQLGVGLVVLGFGASGAIMLLATIAASFGAPWALILTYVSVTMFGASVLLLFLVFPLNRLNTRRGRGVAVSCAVVTLVLMIAYGWVLMVASVAYGALKLATFGVLVVELCGAGLLALTAFLRASPTQREVRHALALIALGTVLALAPFSLLALIPYLLGFGYLVRPETTILSIVFLPASLGVAVMSRQFLGITRLVRRGLVALVVWLFLLGTTSATIVGLERWLSQHDVSAEFDLLVVAVLVATVSSIFWPVQYRLRLELERHLFHDVYDYRRTLHQLSAEIVARQGFEPIATHCLTRLVDILDLAWAALTITGERRPILYPAGAFVDTAALLRVADWRISNSSDGTAPQHRIPLISEDTNIGLLTLGPKRHDAALTPDDVTLVTTLAPLIATALQNALLVRDLEAQVIALREREQALAALSTRLMQVQEDERHRLALDLHDDPLQRAILLARELNQSSHGDQLEQLRLDVEEIITSLRAICAGLRPSILDDFGLVAGIAALIDDVHARAELVVELLVQVEEPSFGRLDSALEVALYRVTQEALNNCLKHAQASRARIVLSRDPQQITLQISDDGRSTTEPPTGEVPGGQQLGILGMRERLQPWGGTIIVDASPINGTTIQAIVPWGDLRAQPA